MVSIVVFQVLKFLSSESKLDEEATEFLVEKPFPLVQKLERYCLVMICDLIPMLNQFLFSFVECLRLIESNEFWTMKPLSKK